ncbi:hypothetical protein, partial [Staphylococcus felis]|uniref:hypothetical protein n=1 Tax=Staphylococcus felis TaxID=46127 RepID=UPI001EE84132
GLNTLIITLSRDFFSITFVAHPHSRWFIVSHVLRAQLTEVINKKVKRRGDSIMNHLYAIILGLMSQTQLNNTNISSVEST